MADNNILSIRDARILFRNFSGKEQRYNPAGNRNFCVILPDDVVDHLKEDGWNIRYLKPREDGDDPTPYVQVKVAFNAFPPKIVLVTKSGKNILNEDNINMLDWAEITKVDLAIRPRHWDDNGRDRVKAYLKTMYVTVYEDDFEQDYDDLPF